MQMERIERGNNSSSLVWMVTQKEVDQYCDLEDFIAVVVT